MPANFGADSAHLAAAHGIRRSIESENICMSWTLRKMLKSLADNDVAGCGASIKRKICLQGRPWIYNEEDDGV